MSPATRIRFTGTEGAGLSTRVAALPFALGLQSLDGQGGGFSWREVGPDGHPYAPASKEEIDSRNRNLFLHLLTAPPRNSEFVDHKAIGVPPRRLQFERAKPSATGQIEVREQRLDDLVGELQAGNGAKPEFSALVICLPIDQKPGPLDEVTRLLRLLRETFFDGGGRRVPWIIFDVTGYDKLFQAIPYERPDHTPRVVALRDDTRQNALELFCADWAARGDISEIMKLAETEQKRRAGPRILFQVSSAWGFLRGDGPPPDRDIANIQIMKSKSEKVGRPRVPLIPPAAAAALASIVSGNVEGVKVSDETNSVLANAAKQLQQFWHPIGITSPILTAVQGVHQPGMVPLLALTDQQVEEPRRGILGWFR